MLRSAAVFITDITRQGEMIQIVATSILCSRVNYRHVEYLSYRNKGPCVELRIREISVICSVCHREGQMCLSDPWFLSFPAVCGAGQPDRVSDLSRRRQRAQVRTNQTRPGPHHPPSWASLECLSGKVLNCEGSVHICHKWTGPRGSNGRIHAQANKLNRDTGEIQVTWIARHGSEQSQAALLWLFVHCAACFSIQSVGPTAKTNKNKTRNITRVSHWAPFW